MLYNTRETYGLVAQLLHWVTAALIFVLLPLGVFMHELPIGTTEEIAFKSWFYSLHKTLGVTVFCIAIIRVIWAFAQPKPVALNTERKGEHFLASTIHWTLYGSIILMPLTGWAHHSALEGFAPIWWPFGQDIPFIPKNTDLAAVLARAHFLLAIVLVTSLVLHIAGAVKHAVVYRDLTLKRMLPGVKVDVDVISGAKPSNKLTIAVAIACFLAVGVGAVIRPHSHHDHADDTHAHNEGVSAHSQNADVGNDGIARWTIDHAKSELGFSITQNKVPVNGKFEKWNAEIAFDADQLEASFIQVSVDIASLNLGPISDKALDQPLLNVKQFPTAEFVAKQIVGLGENQFEARGELTLIGNTRPFVLPFSLEIKEGRAFATAQASFQRLDFGIGEKGFQTDGAVGLDVELDVMLEAKKAN